MRLVLLVLAFASVPLAARAQDVTPMPTSRAIAGHDASACAGGEAPACVRAADVRLRAGDGASANVLYRRGADLARDAMHVPQRRAVSGTVRSVARAVSVLEGSWDTLVVRAAALHGGGDLARSARERIFGQLAVASWAGRRARVADAFAAVHTMTEREGGAFAANAWLGDLATLAADGPCWEIRFAYQDLDVVAYVDDAGRILAVLHPPEG